MIQNTTTTPPPIPSPTLLTKQPNTSHPTHHRIYHRSQQPPLDSQTIINYLSQNNYTNTLNTFQQQIQYQSQIRYQKQLKDYIDVQDDIDIHTFYNFIQNIRKTFTAPHNQFLKLQFMLTIWYCTHNSHNLPPQNLKLLKNFIQKNGSKLSQFPQTLPYFALPYIHQPTTHPFLQKIYTKQWKNSIKQLLINSTTPPKKYLKYPLTQNTQQSQWLIIIKDLLQICIYFQSKTNLKNIKHFQMLQRVKKYQKVIEDNDTELVDAQSKSIKQSELSQLVFKSSSKENPQNKQTSKSQHSIASVSSVNQCIYQQLSFPSLKTSIKSYLNHPNINLKQICLIYYALHCRIQQTHTPNRKKQIIKLYTQNDIFFLQQRQSFPTLFLQIQCLKLINTMCASSMFIQYLAKSQMFVNQICSIVISNKDNFINNSKHSNKNLQVQQQRLLQSFAILQKITFNKQIIIKLMKTQLPTTLFLHYSTHYQNLTPSLLTYVLALILNLILSPQSKQFCSNIPLPNPNTSPPSPQHISLFQLNIKIWQHIQTLSLPPTPQNQFTPDSPYTQLQSLVYSIFYILLTLNNNKSLAKTLNFKSLLHIFLSTHQDQYHIKIINYMLTVLDDQYEREQQLQSNNNDKCDEFDDDYQNSFIEIKGYVWVSNQLLQLDQKLIANTDQILQKYYKHSIKPPSSQNPPKLTHKKTQQIPQQNLHDNHLYQNISTPNFVIQNNSIKKQKCNLPKQTQFCHPLDNKCHYKHTTLYQQVDGYDPSKYQAWKKLKTVHT